MSKETVLIVGSSGHSKVIIDIFEKQARYTIVGLLDSKRNPGEETLGYSILGNEENLPEIIDQYPDCKLFVAIGDNWIRHKVVNKLISIIPTINFVSAVHPSALIGKNVTIGKGVAVMAGAIINSNTHIDDFAIINTKASIDHDSQMGEFSSLAPGVTTGGNVSIGAFAAISIGATIKHGISVGEHALVGAGSLLIKNCSPHSVMYGVPARVIRMREPGEKYL